MEAIVFSGENAADEPTAIHDRWSYVNNLDEFFLRMYRYYHEKGVVAFAAARIANLACVTWRVTPALFSRVHP